MQKFSMPWGLLSIVSEKLGMELLYVTFATLKYTKNEIKTKKMSIVSFGKYEEGINYKVLNERQVRASAGIMFLIGLMASINGLILKNYSVIPYLSGFLLFSFSIAVLINPRYSPTMMLGYIFVRKQTPLYIGAVQKRFAWSLGMAMSAAIFVLSIFLLTDATYFEPLCQLCIICLILLYLETAFGICVGCKLYFLAIRLKLMKKPTVRPNCMGDACEV